MYNDRIEIFIILKHFPVWSLIFHVGLVCGSVVWSKEIILYDACEVRNQNFFPPNHHKDTKLSQNLKRQDIPWKPNSVQKTRKNTLNTTTPHPTVKMRIYRLTPLLTSYNCLSGREVEGQAGQDPVNFYCFLE